MCLFCLKLLIVQSKGGKEALLSKCGEDASLVFKPFDEKFFQRNFTLTRTLKVSLALKIVTRTNNSVSPKHKAELSVAAPHKFKLELASVFPTLLLLSVKWDGFK